MPHFQALLALTLFGLFWALTVPMTKIAVSTGHQPPGLIFWQLVIAVLVLGAVVFFTNKRLLLSMDALRYYLVIALLGTLFPNSFSYLAAAHLPAGVMAISLATVPMFSLLIALVIRSEVFQSGRLLGVLLGAVAVSLLIWPEESLPDPEKTVFVLVALVAAASYGAEGNYVARRAMQQVDPVVAVFGASIIGLIICLPVVIFGDFWVPVYPAPGKAELALLASSLIHALVYTGYIWLVGKTSAVFASQIAYVVTIGGVLASALVLRETYSAWVMASLLLMMLGLFLVQPKQKTSTY
ncbi:MAG: DMT family transporter [Acidiferrobacterales bacterium]|nr:DMT family transporter [Acidiferrobacterales bacterium]